MAANVYGETIKYFKSELAHNRASDLPRYYGDPFFRLLGKIVVVEHSSFMGILVCVPVDVTSSFFFPSIATWSISRPILWHRIVLSTKPNAHICEGLKRSHLHRIPQPLNVNYHQFAPSHRSRSPLHFFFSLNIPEVNSVKVYRKYIYLG